MVLSFGTLTSKGTSTHSSKYNVEPYASFLGTSRLARQALSPTSNASSNFPLYKIEGKLYGWRSCTSWSRGLCQLYQPTTSTNLEDWSDLKNMKVFKLKIAYRLVYQKQHQNNRSRVSKNWSLQIIIFYSHWKRLESARWQHSQIKIYRQFLDPTQQNHQVRVANSPQHHLTPAHWINLPISANYQLELERNNVGVVFKNSI